MPFNKFPIFYLSLVEVERVECDEFYSHLIPFSSFFVNNVHLVCYTTYAILPCCQMIFPNNALPFFFPFLLALHFVILISSPDAVHSYRNLYQLNSMLVIASTRTYVDSSRLSLITQQKPFLNWKGEQKGKPFKTLFCFFFLFLPLKEEIQKHRLNLNNAAAWRVFGATCIKKQYKFDPIKSKKAIQKKLIGVLFRFDCVSHFIEEFSEATRSSIIFLALGKFCAGQKTDF